MTKIRQAGRKSSAARRIHPRTPLPVLVRALRNANVSRWWREDHGETVRSRSLVAVLTALADLLDHSGAGELTHAQIANQAGCCTRTVARALAQLDALGMIATYRPGWVNAGVPVPSFLALDRSKLAAYVHALRPRNDAALAAHHRAQRERLDGRTLFARKAKPQVNPMDSVSNPSPQEGGPRRLRPWETETYCEKHGGILGRCPGCRYQT